MLKASKVNLIQPYQVQGSGFRSVVRSRSSERIWARLVTVVVAIVAAP